jgi:ABC-2 type transport system ATP-binding protein
MSAITVRGLRKSYGGRTVVDGVDFDVEEGEIFALLGPNGAGKTTTVEMVSGVRHRDGGEVRFHGLDPDRDGAELANLVGVQLQSAQLPEKIRVHEAVELFSSFYVDPVDGDELLDRLHLGETRRRQWGKLSGGQQQRLAVALALIGRPKVAILDEVTTGLDPQARRDAWELISSVRASGVTIVLVTHFMEEAERLADRVALFDAGRITAMDSPAGLIATRTRDRQEIRFRIDGDATTALAELRALPDVTTVDIDDDTVTITGTGDVLLSVTSLIARHGVVARDLRVHQATLDDAVLSPSREGQFS